VQEDADETEGVDIGEGSPIAISFRGRQATISRPPKCLAELGDFSTISSGHHPCSLGQFLPPKTPICKSPPPTPPKGYRFRHPRVRLLLASITDLAGHFHLAAESAPSPSFLPPHASNKVSVDPRASVPRSHFRSLPNTHPMRHIALFTIRPLFHNILFL
jgi:hypothetical protein